MTAIDGDFAYSFLLGVVAAVNPCGFVMLPAYLAYYLGLDDGDQPTAPARIARALKVGAAVSLGFITVFVAVGVLVRSIDALDSLPTKARWAGLVIGIAMTLGGVAMVFGWNPRVSTAAIARRHRRKRSVWSMFAFGIAYAIASIGCTIGLFLSVILGSFTRDGFVGGTLATAAYGFGMGMLVVALTVATAFARSGLGARLSRLSRHVPMVAGVIVSLSGAYLAWYWYGAIFRPAETSAVGATIGAWQTDLTAWLEARGSLALLIGMSGTIATCAGVLIVSRTIRTRPSRTDQASTKDAASPEPRIG